MTITGRTLAELRDLVLDGITARATAAGLTIDTGADSDAWKEAETLATMALGYEKNAEDLAAEIDPRTSSEETLDRWLRITAQTTGDGVAGAYSVTVTGTNGTISIGSRVLIRNGKRYLPASSTVVISGGTGTLAVDAAEAGTASALAAGDTLRWDAAPLGLDPTASVAVVLTDAEDADGVEDKRTIVRDYLRARPSGGNPAQIKQLAERHRDCVVAYVYPCVAPGAAVQTWDDARLDVPGTFLVVILGPTQGDDPVVSSHARARTSTQRGNVQAYLRGTQDADGNTLSRPVGQRFSTQVLPTDVEVAYANLDELDVETTITPTQAQTPGWSGTMTVHSSTTTQVVVNGNHETKIGEEALFFVGIAAARGGWVKRTIESASYDGGTTRTTLTLDEALPDTATGTVYPVVGHWEALRDAHFAFFDGLGPGDVPGPDEVTPAIGTTRRRRFPPISWGAKANVSLADLLRLAFAAEGTLDAAVVAPASDLDAVPLTLPVLGTLLIRPA